MISLHKIDEQLKQIGSSFQYWGRREVRELSKIMTETEEIKQCVNGHYQGGFAMLTATNQRLLLIDRKPMFLTVEAIWYDKIGQVDFNHRLLNASICVSTPNKELNFTSWNSVHLREIMLYTQEKMTEAKERTGQLSSGRPGAYYEARELEPQQQPRYLEPSPAVAMHPRRESAATPAQLVNAYDNTRKLDRGRLPFSRRRYFTQQEPA